MKKGIGVGIEDFKKIIDEDCYYFDKTNYIEELLKDKTEIKLFTRPRRFGKTLNMTTLKNKVYSLGIHFNYVYWGHKKLKKIILNFS